MVVKTDFFDINKKILPSVEKIDECLPNLVNLTQKIGSRALNTALPGKKTVYAGLYLANGDIPIILKVYTRPEQLMLFQAQTTDEGSSLAEFFLQSLVFILKAEED